MKLHSSIFDLSLIHANVYSHLHVIAAVQHFAPTEQNDIASEVVSLIHADFPAGQSCRSHGFDARQPDRRCTLLYHSGLNNSELFVYSAVVQPDGMKLRNQRTVLV